jgi:hypothetical protein
MGIKLWTDKIKMGIKVGIKTGPPKKTLSGKTPLRM